MPEPSAPEPEESATDKEDKVYLKNHPRLRIALLVGRSLLVPIAVAVAGTIFNGRLDKNKSLAETGYGVLAAPVQDLQKQVAALGGQVQVLQQLVLTLAYAQPLQPSTTPPAPTGYGVFSNGARRVPHTPMPAPPAPNQAVDNFKRGLVEKVQKSQGERPVLRHAVPAKLDDAMRQAF